MTLSRSLHILILFVVMFSAGCNINNSNTNQPTPRKEDPDVLGATTFSYCSPGNLLGEKERGFSLRRVFVNSMHFPIEIDSKTHQLVSNSQMYMFGGYCSSGDCGQDVVGSTCAKANFSMPWRDTFCEKAGRTYGTTICPDKIGHQGIDIRTPTLMTGETNGCRRDFWHAVAVDDGIVSFAKGAVVKLRSAAGITYTYRHLNPKSINDLTIRAGDKVKRGERLGRIDQFNNNGTRRYTTIHLHIEASMRDEGGRTVFIPLYTSLVSSYRELLGIDNGIDNGGNLLFDEKRESNPICMTNKI